jgi:hypothetical protein
VNPAILRDLYKLHPFAAVLEFSANVAIGLVEKLDQAEAVDFVPGHRSRPIAWKASSG